LSYAQAQNQTYLALCPIFIQLNIFAMDTQEGCPLKNVLMVKQSKKIPFSLIFQTAKINN
jgi:hypothetical protein